MLSILKRIPAWLVTGLLCGLAWPSFPNLPSGVLAWFGFVPLLLSLQKAKNFKSYFLQTYSACILMNWGIGWWTGYYGWEAFAVVTLFQVMIVWLPFGVLYFLQKRVGWQNGLVCLPFIWTSSEWLTLHLEHNLQVTALAYSQSPFTWLVQFADTTGMWGISFWVMGLNVLLTLVIGHYRNNRTYILTTLSSIVVYIALPILYSTWVIGTENGIEGNRKAEVALVQTNQDSYAGDYKGHVDDMLKELFNLSDSAARQKPQPDLIVLPEGALPFPLFKDSVLFRSMRQTVANWGTSVAVGYTNIPDSTQKFYENNTLVFTPQMTQQWDSLHLQPSDIKVYQKQEGLPFVEFMPYVELFTDKAVVPPKRNAAIRFGHEPYSFSFPDAKGEVVKTVASVCWEQMFPEIIAGLVREDADFISFMMNDGWFGRSPGARQLTSYTRLRAIENRRSVARCSNTGISCFIDPYGRITKALPWHVSTIGMQTVQCNRALSFYTEHGAWLPKLCIGLLSLVLAGSWLLRKNKFKSII